MAALQSHLLHTKYRPDIDGLRAIAVLSVVAFHAFPDVLKGGFIGVDIFFVISGFLITTIIFENLERGTFSFAVFYARRIKRIFPALLIVLVACYVFGWFTLLANEYRQLGKHLAAGASFSSNFILWGEAGYFDSSAEAKPLLHLWSLGIEEQFYIFWPVLLWLAWRCKLNFLALTFLIACVSFYLNTKGVEKDSAATFFSPQTRFWELLCGSLLAWAALYKQVAFATFRSKIDGWLASRSDHAMREAHGKKASELLSLFGSVLLAYGFWQISKESIFPGNWAVLPVLGAVLIIAAGPQAWVNRTLLSSRLAVGFGLISFPLYLWHWPLLSFARIVEGEMPNVSIRLVVVLLSIVLAWLTYKLIERPVRVGKNNKHMVAVLVTLMGTVGISGYFTFTENGLPYRAYHQRFSSYANSIKVPERASECFEIPYAYKKSEGWYCNLGKKDAPVKYFAYGDSHALSMVPALDKLGEDSEVRVQFTGTSGCPSLLGIQSMRGDAGIEKYNCRALNERVFNHVKTQEIENVILINRWNYYTGSISRPAELNLISRSEEVPISKETSAKDFAWAVQNTVERYKSIGVNVILVEDNPQQLREPNEVLRKGFASDEHYLKFSVQRDEHLNNQKSVNDIIRAQGVKVINFDEVLCGGKICPLVKNSKFLYSDDDHLSVEGALNIYPILARDLVN
ncbi:acyltransferase family protein [Pseudomonas sp.]|uniref:acyltransferase family protein n=1 Tax=Pseudomonas sp. TaxID=306 RepID=UPI003D6F0326